jgi:hypothetical protein
MKTMVFIAGKQIDISMLSFKDMDLSSSRDRAKQSEYSVHIPRQKFMLAMSAVYDGAVLDLKRDDRLTGKTDFFGNAGYPPIERLVEEPALLSKVFSAYFASEVFAQILPTNSIVAPGAYVIDTVERVATSNDVVTVQGRCQCL